MAFADLATTTPAVQLLQRSLASNRLGHAYLFTGQELAPLEQAALTLAKTLNCQHPPRRNENGLPLDCCDQCIVCRKITGEIHPDIQWIRPESKTRVITVDAVRELMQLVNLKPTEADYKVAVLVGADRLNMAAANAFLKTLEEPPANSILILLSTEPDRLLETILSRCLRLNFSGAIEAPSHPRIQQWMSEFATQAAAEQKSLLSRYRLLGSLLQQLAALRVDIEEALTARSPLQKYPDAENDLRDKWETELSSSIEAEYRRQRTDWLLALQWWLRDVWLQSAQSGQDLLSYPGLALSSAAVSRRLRPQEAMVNIQTLERTQRLLYTNAQEALVLEIGLLQLKL
jgi:DNA polymerase-3 subunit delta'